MTRHPFHSIARAVALGVVLSISLSISPSIVPSTAAWASGPSWIFRPSQYTHDPATGERVAQFAAPPLSLKPDDPSFERSAYRHSRSGFSVGGTFDYLHTVETWGRGESIRPYGEWLYPFRAGATPYGPWGNPQGPWTTPFGSWVNPYGLGRLPGMPWVPWIPGGLGQNVLPQPMPLPQPVAPVAPSAPSGAVDF